MITVNFRNLMFSQNVRIEHNGILISLVGSNPDMKTCNSHMEGMRLYRDGVDITHFHPAYMDGCDVDVSDFDDILRVIRLIDDGCFKDAVITLNDGV